MLSLRFSNLTDRDFTNIWKVHIFSGGVVFQAEEKLFIFKNGEIKVVIPSTTFHTSFVVNDILYIRERGTGLLKWYGTGFIKIEGSEIFENTGIFLMVPYGKKMNEILIGTREKGFYTFGSSGKENHFNTLPLADTRLIEKSVVTGGVPSTNGSIAISTMLSGIIVIDSSGHITDIINQKSGLADNDVKQVIKDNSQNLWLALNKGISTIEITSPFSLYSEKSGIHGNINTVISYRGLIYAGTTDGLFVRETKSANENIFLPVTGISSPVRSMVEADGSLFFRDRRGAIQDD